MSDSDVKGCLVAWLVEAREGLTRPCWIKFGHHVVSVKTVDFHQQMQAVGRRGLDQELKQVTMILGKCLIFFKDFFKNMNENPYTGEVC